MKLAASRAWLDVGWLRDDDVLAGVVVRSAFTFVLGLLDGCLLVALIQVGYDIGVQVLNFLFQRRECLNSRKIPTVTENLNSTYFDEFILAENGFEEMFSSIGRLTEGMGTLEMPLSYSLRLSSDPLLGSGM